MQPSGPGPGHKLDVVIAHHDHWNEWEMRPYWEKFLSLPEVAHYPARLLFDSQQLLTVQQLQALLALKRCSGTLSD